MAGKCVALKNVLAIQLLEKLTPHRGLSLQGLNFSRQGTIVNSAIISPYTNPKHK